MPVEVRRWVLAPLAWLVLVLPAVAAWAVVDVRDAVAPPIPASRSMVLPATVEPSYDGGLEVGLAYDNPVTGQRVVAQALMFDDARRPTPGAVLDVLVDRDDPDSIALPGSGQPLWSTLAEYAWLPLVPVVVALVRLRATARVRRLVDDDGPSFSMLGTVTRAASGEGRLLHLYPLDAAVASRPLCSVPLACAGDLLPGGAAFPVEVKGSPRAFGRVVARHGRQLLWPAQRAVDARDVPRPDHVDPTGPHRPPGGSTASTAFRLPVAGLAVMLVPAVGLLLAVATVTATHARAAAAAYRHGQPVLAQVTSADLLWYELRVAYTGEDAVVRSAIAPVDWPEDYTVGRRYPAVLLPDPGMVRLRAEPYDGLEPITWATIPTGFIAALIARERIYGRRRPASAAAPGQVHADASRTRR